MKKAIVFGSQNHLVGILEQCPSDKPLVLMWNVGVMNRTGPYRFQTEMADTLLEDGFSSFRFDVGGRGDSKIRDDIAEDFERSVSDALEALEYIKSNFDYDKFIIYGHCTSAVEGHIIASLCPEVVGLAMVDTYSFRVGKFKSNYYQNRLLSAKRLKAAAKNKITRHLDQEDSEKEDLFEGFYPEQEDLSSHIDEFIEREIPLYVHYTGGFEFIYNYKEQFLDMFPNLRSYKGLELYLQKDADHLFSTLDARDVLKQQLRGWLKRNFKQEKNINNLNYLFSESFKRYSKASALNSFAKSLSYKELDRKTINLAAKLQKDGLQKGDRVAVALKRSEELVVSVLAILRAGAAYVPCDISYPKNRLEKIISISKPKAIITDGSAIAYNEYPAMTNYSLDDISDDKVYSNYKDPQLSESDPAYIIFTSGSTGDPKGVTLGHGALSNLLKWQQRLYPAEKGLKTLQYTPIGFDVSFQEIGSAIVGGSELYLIDQQTRVDPVKFLRFINDNKINRIFLPFVALQNLCESSELTGIYPRSLKEVFSAGEQLQITSSVRKFFKKLDGAKLHNHYGPSESHVITAYSMSGNPDLWPDLPPIGKVVDNNKIHIVDEDMEISKKGELFLEGSNLALGYFGRDDLTEKSFLKTSKLGKFVYKTGDLVELDDNGDLLYLGRLDSQVKIRGHRIELADIELALEKMPDITAICVNPIKNDGQTQLVAYVISSSKSFDWLKAKEDLQKILPDYMIPAHCMILSELPKTPSGKISRRDLPWPKLASTAQSEKQTTTAQDNRDLRGQLIAAFSEVLSLQAKSDTHFFDAGGTSLQAMKLIATLLGKYKIELAVAQLYNFPTPSGLYSYLSGSTDLSSMGQRSKKSSLRSGVAVIGMSLKGPGFKNISEFDRLLSAKKEALTKFSEADLSDDIPKESRLHGDYVKSRGIVEDSEMFDNQFFKISPAVARIMDPQQRKLLEEAWHCLEDGGIDPETFRGLCGVWVGVSHNSYYLNNVLKSGKVGKAFSAFDAMLANDKDYSATRIAHALNLKGPAINVQTACSTSLVAIINAARAILNGETDIALAGGANMTFPREQGHLYQEGSIYSKDGSCRPFDENASGTYFSDGVGLVLLKDLDEAVKDGDRIYSVIRGAGINNDGKDKASFSAPHAVSQAFAIRTALDEAGWKGSDINYLEAHATATPIGDPIEFSGIEMAYEGSDFKRPLCIGSLKANFGHLTAASGVSGFIKASLSVYLKKIYPQINFGKLNPQIKLDPKKFEISKELKLLDDEKVRSAVSSFGVGGTNAHLVMEGYSNKSEATPNSEIVLLSAKTEASLERHLSEWQDFLEDYKGSLSALSLSSIKRPHFSEKKAIVASSLAELRQAFSNNKFLKAKSSSTKKLVFAFPGQGSQYVGMGKGLYESSEVFKASADTIAILIKKHLGYDLTELLYSDNVEKRAEKDLLNNTFYTQPALFLTAYSLAKHWMSEGLKPDAMIGHSIGEIVAATIAGSFRLEDAVALICERARLVKALPTGSMLALSLDPDAAKEYLSEKISLAAINGPKRTVLAGRDEDIEELSRRLSEKRITNKKLHTSHAFHSYMMDSMTDEFLEFVSTLKIKAPDTDIYSTVTAKLINEDMCSAEYWSNHVRSCVAFYPALESLKSELEDFVLLEIGPRSTLKQLSSPVLGKNSLAISSLDFKSSQKGSKETLAIDQAKALLWLNNLYKFKVEAPDKAWTPGYSFEKNKFLLEAESKLETKNLVLEKENEMSSQDKLKELITADLVELLSEASGMDLAAVDQDTEFLDLGLDSLVLTQVSLNLEKKFKTKISFRQLNDELVCLADLSAYLTNKVDSSLYESQLASPPAVEQPMQAVANPQDEPVATFQAPTHQMPLKVTTSSSGIESIINNQLQLMQNQLALLGGKVNLNKMQSQPSAKQESEPIEATKTETKAIEKDSGPEDEKKNFGAMAKIKRKERVKASDLQLETVSLFTQSYNKATKKSKEYSQKHRSYMSDPRVVTGFKSSIKEIIYPIVVDKSSGSTLWDIDGRKYVDMLNGFGSNYYGYQAPFLKKAIAEQMEKGYEIGPQHELVGDLSKRVSSMIGVERVAWCNTGSEAVLGAMRMARTVTGRDKIVTFSGSYHGICDEVIVRKGLKTAMPAAPGIMKEAVKNIVTLDYGSDEAIDYIREHADDIAAVLIEPVQSRRPEYRPVEFWKEVREITKKSGSAMILDEVITGFRYHQAGVNGAYNLDADIITYGKIIGGGLPIGMIGGKARFLDALDGGAWQYGDSSVPEVGVTYFAGTFVRHPLALAGAYATIKHMEEKGPSLHDEINAKADYLAAAINDFSVEHELPYRWENFGSLMKFKVTDASYMFADLVAHYMRLKGVHIWDGFPTFTSAAHTQEDLDFVIRSFKESVREMALGGLLSKDGSSRNIEIEKAQYLDGVNPSFPPREGAFLAKDDKGYPAWFVKDDQGKVVKL